MPCSRSRSGPARAARTVSASWRFERWALWTNCRHGSLSANGSSCGRAAGLGAAKATAPT